MSKTPLKCSTPERNGKTPDSEADDVPKSDSTPPRVDDLNEGIELLKIGEESPIDDTPNDTLNDTLNDTADPIKGSDKDKYVYFYKQVEELGGEKAYYTIKWSKKEDIKAPKTGNPNQCLEIFTKQVQKAGKVVNEMFKKARKDGRRFEVTPSNWILSSQKDLSDLFEEVIDDVFDEKFNHKPIGYLYVVRTASRTYYKVGITESNPKMRLGQLQEDCPYDLEKIEEDIVEDFKEAEKELLKNLKSSESLEKTKGSSREWFQSKKGQEEFLENNVLKEYKKVVEKYRF